MAPCSPAPPRPGPGTVGTRVDLARRGVGREVTGKGREEARWPGLERRRRGGAGSALVGAQARMDPKPGLKVPGLAQPFGEKAVEGQDSISRSPRSCRPEEEAQDMSNLGNGGGGGVSCSEGSQASVPM
jgi:hypothetical protein